MIRWLAWMIFVTASVVGGHWLLDRPSVPQLMDFNHAIHEGVGCTLCHAGVTARAGAGLPLISLCAECHAQPPFSDPVAREVWDLFLAEGGTPWQSLFGLPDHAYFSHRRHLYDLKDTNLTCE